MAKLSPEQRKAQSERMKKMWAEKKKLKDVGPDEEVVKEEDLQDTVKSQPLPQVPQVDPNLIATVMATVQAMQASNPQIAQATVQQKLEEIERITPKNTATVGQNGVQGIIFRYEVDKGYYPDPTERLINEPSLKRFALQDNFIFRWAVDGVEYKKDNITYAEPRFTVELFRRLYDDEGQPTGRAALIARNMLHEDEMTTRVAASRLGILNDYTNDDEGFRQLMNEIRYRRIQEWLFGIFTPPKVQTHKRRQTTEVIDGKVVEVFDTEEITDKATASNQAANIQRDSGVGGVSTPGGM